MEEPARLDLYPMEYDETDENGKYLFLLRLKNISLIFEASIFRKNVIFSRPSIPHCAVGGALINNKLSEIIQSQQSN